ncbi:hypothetical protein [Mucilaginibacter rubeus]|uniref:Uncharacterized protein n=1 Tax=Mucilaginibacter rubeus TaxID=2027860 RepID=A0A5C1HTY9_9SPHI|nr:hypothetical protein [Mucilaginibacter rubeus]QEM09085.1 hypothetical protein DEO27_003320 [Mucilaginibacter rubeus]
MLTQQIAERALYESLADLQQKKGNLILQDVETETINVGCLLLLEHYRQQISSHHNINQLQNYVDANMRFYDSALWFTNYAARLFPQDYTQNHVTIAAFMIVQNISWAGMWDFLREYFFKTHGRAIDDVESDICVFDSVRHERYENNIMINNSVADRKVIVNFTDEKKRAMISIEPTLSAKGARLSRRNGNQLEYIGEDSDYAFQITLNRFDQIERFILKMPNRQLEIIYYV